MAYCFTSFSSTDQHETNNIILDQKTFWNEFYARFLAQFVSRIKTMADNRPVHSKNCTMGDQDKN